MLRVQDEKASEDQIPGDVNGLTTFKEQHAAL